ncbi:MAG TPA: HPr(Ser) kinase/phosphatase [Burkholderiales bacterium]|nr:HPr(Ser) kinase/phosphatase [Burkholderiales bacterium]
MFEDNRAKLKLEWVAGRDHAAAELDSERIKSATQGLIGHLNLVHSNWIQIVGPTESRYLEGLNDTEREQVLRQIAAAEIACIIVGGGAAIPPALTTLTEARQIPVLRSAFDSVELMWLLRPYLARALAEATTIHGVLLDVLGMGVLITGDSGVGKSELALELVSRGSGLIADDVVELYRIGPETVEGRCPLLLKDFLEVRGLGVLNMRTIFGEAALRLRKNLKLIVHLEKPSSGDPGRVERLPLNAGSQEVLGVPIRRMTIPVAAGRNLAVLVEAAVRNYVLQLRGVDSTLEFITRQEEQLGRGG